MIVRMKHRRMYVPLSVKAARFSGMQPEELGVYACMLAHPDGWEFREDLLAKELGVSKQRIGEILQTLCKMGFTRMRMGRLGQIWDLYEAPRADDCVPETSAPEQTEKQKPAPPFKNGPADGQAGKRTLTNEQMARVFFEKAAELKRRGKQSAEQRNGK